MSSRSEPASRLAPSGRAHAALGDALSSVGVWCSLLPPGRADPHPSRWGRPLGIADRERIAPPRLRGGELDLGREQDRLLKRPRAVKASGRRAERREAAGLGPHAVGDRAREAERLRGQGVHVDRVAVAGDGGVAAAEIAAAASSSRSPAARVALRPRRRAASSPLPRRRSWRPSQASSSPTRASVTIAKCGPSGAAASAVGADLQRQLARRPRRPVLDDQVVDVDEADRAEREAAVGHQRHVQREGEHVRVGRRQRVAQGEAADAGVLARPLGVDDDAGSSSSSSGTSPPPAGQERQPRGAGEHGAAARA